MVYGKTNKILTLERSITLFIEVFCLHAGIMQSLCCHDRCDPWACHDCRNYCTSCDNDIVVTMFKPCIYIV